MRSMFLWSLLLRKLVLKRLNFTLRQKPPFTRVQLLIFERTNPHAPQFVDRCSHDLKHAADLLIPSLMQRHLIPGFRSRLDLRDFAGSEPLVIQVNSATQPIHVASAGSLASLTW